ncbi:MAG: hypothetical protein AAF231_03055 [Pseudomonadota bacterium]
MKQLICVPVLVFALASPVVAEEENAPSLMERGMELFMEGLRQEMEPALNDLQGFAEEMGPAFRQFGEAMGPMMRDLFEKVDDINLYELPEVLPNGDIIIRRKPDAKPLEEGEIEI